MSESTRYEPLTLAMYVLTNTSSLHVGTGAVQMFTRSPTVLGVASLTLANASGNRFSLGLGLATAAMLRDWHGVVVDHPFERAEDYLSIIAKLLAGDGAPLRHVGHRINLPSMATERVALTPLRSTPPTLTFGLD